MELNFTITVNLIIFPIYRSTLSVPAKVTNNRLYEAESQFNNIWLNNIPDNDGNLATKA